MLSKRGVSPLIATVLIIGFTVALAAIIFTWGSSFVKDTTEQTSQNARSSLSCTLINYDAEFNNDCSFFIISNNAEVVLSKISLRGIYTDGSITSLSFPDPLSSW